MKLEGKIAVVTGGTKGIGLAIAETLLQNGARVFICGRSKSGLRTALERLSPLGPIHGELTDVRSEEQVRSMLDKCE